MKAASHSTASRPTNPGVPTSVERYVRGVLPILRQTPKPDAERLAPRALDAYLETFSAHGWHHAAFEDHEAIQNSADRVHVARRFTRYDEHGAALAAYPSLWILTLAEGHWGSRVRSSFAP